MAACLEGSASVLSAFRRATLCSSHRRRAGGWQDAAWQTVRERARNAAGTANLIHDQHVAIADAIALRDPAQAEEAMRQHLLTLQESLVRITSLDRQETRGTAEHI